MWRRDGRRVVFEATSREFPGSLPDRPRRIERRHRPPAASGLPVPASSALVRTTLSPPGVDLLERRHDLQPDPVAGEPDRRWSGLPMGDAFKHRPDQAATRREERA